MSLGVILLIFMIFVMAGVFPAWPYSRDFGYGPSSVVGLLVVILIVLLFLGRI